jgi:hypothetical protein
LIQQIAIACDFHNLKKADSEVKIKDHMKEDEPGKPSAMYRKGKPNIHGDKIIGCGREFTLWKNWKMT